MSLLVNSYLKDLREERSMLFINWAASCLRHSLPSSPRRGWTAWSWPSRRSSS